MRLTECTDIKSLLGRRAAVTAIVAVALGVLDLLGPGFALRNVQAQTVQDLACRDDSSDADRRIEACTKVIESGRYRGAELAWAFNARGLAKNKGASWDKAIADFSEAIRLKPDYAEAYRNRGLSYLLNGIFFHEGREDYFYQLAIDDFTAAIRLKPDYAEAFANRGEVFQKKKQYDRAIENYDQAIRLKPDFDGAYSGRAGAYAGKGELDRAIDDFNQAIRLKPDNADHHLSRAFVYKDKGEYDKAIEDFNQVLRLKPGVFFSFGAYAHRGRAHFKKQNYDQAIADAKSALALANAPWVREDLRQAEEAKRAVLARAQVQASGKRIALIIANGAYANASPLPNALRDADDLAGELKKLGYEIFGHPVKNFSKEQLEGALTAFAEAAQGASAAIVWYSGHGQQMREEGNDSAIDWVIPIDAAINRRADVASNAIRVDRVINTVLAAKRLRLVVIDACRNTRFWNDTRGITRRNVERPGVLVVYSAQPGNIAIDDMGDGSRNSPFARAFLETLRADPKRDVQKLFDAVIGRTEQLTKGEQRPQPIGGMGTGETVPMAQ